MLFSSKPLYIQSLNLLSSVILTDKLTLTEMPLSGSLPESTLKKAVVFARLFPSVAPSSAQHWIKYTHITSIILIFTPAEEWSTNQRVCISIRLHIFKTTHPVFTNFYMCYLWLLLSYPLRTTQFVTYGTSGFCRWWSHVFISGRS